ncbi:UNVERIFIED_CONTAM: hypothetical protein GTU68_061524 [Idotea baltica]|nr:hypothetical protein [Idotea baltica]
MSSFSFTGLTLEKGDFLSRPTIQYKTYGTLNHSKTNVIWVCHALTGNANVHDWWTGIFGEGKLLDPSKYFIVCANIIGSCYGSTNPLSINPYTNKPYFHAFPEITIRDISRSLIRLRQHLGIQEIQLLIGGSLGGQQAIEWAIIEPNKIKNLAIIASNAKHSAWGIAFNESQRMAIKADKTWGENTHNAGLKGLETARAIALLSYRNYNTYNETQTNISACLNTVPRAASYQQYQGGKLAQRFNAFSYWHLSKAMDTHNVGRNRGGCEKALKQITAKTITISISTDILFPPEESAFIAQHIPNAQSFEIDSLYGHDGFLLEHDKIQEIITNNLNLVTKTAKSTTPQLLPTQQHKLLFLIQNLKKQYV